LAEHDLSENRFPARIKSAAGFFRIMLEAIATPGGAFAVASRCGRLRWL
jgi:hypothetical protein